MHSLEYSSVYPLCHIILILDGWVHMWPCLQFSLDNSAAGPPDISCAGPWKHLPEPELSQAQAQLGPNVSAMCESY